MRIQDYIDEQARHLDNTSERIRDFHVFDFNYIPEQPLMRDEVKPVIDACLRYLKTGIANHLTDVVNLSDHMSQGHSRPARVRSPICHQIRIRRDYPNHPIPLQNPLNDPIS